MPHLERQYDDLSRPVREFAFVVDATEVGMRLDALLRKHYPWKSRAHFQRMLGRGDVHLDGHPAKASARARRLQQVVVHLPADPEAPEVESAEDLVFLYEDEHLAAIDKPSGMAVHPSGRLRHGTLINKLHAHYRHEDPARDVVPRLGHRLDQDTSGVVLVVKSRRVDALITEAFSRRRVSKTYLAILRGVPEADEDLIDAPLGRDPEGASHLNMRVDPEGLPSQSRLQVRRRWARHTLAELRPLTGRQHQLRVHMAWRGLPVACDHLYGDVRPLRASEVRPVVRLADEEILLSRLALHSHRLELTHPITREPLCVESPLPPDLATAVASLDRLSAVAWPEAS